MEADEKACPYCAETIKAAAIKCRWCGEMLTADAEKPVTFVRYLRHGDPMLCSDGSPLAFLDAITRAVESVGLSIVNRDYANLSLSFESRGMTLTSWSGERTTVVLSNAEGGSIATFASRNNPSGILRLMIAGSPHKWIGRLIPGFGSLWRAGYWHPDPYERHELRLYDGRRWSEHVSDAGAQSTDPPDS